MQKVEVSEKVCRKCKKPQPISSFPKSKQYSDGYMARCKSCVSAYVREYRKTDAGKRNAANGIRKFKAYHLAKKFGITESQYNTLFLFQQGRCAICGIHQNELKLALAVDHCHTTNKVRALLCSHCNTGLGLFKENVDILQSAIGYLSRHC